MIGNNRCLRTIGWALLCFSMAAPLQFPVLKAAAETVLFRENFDSRENWKPLLFPKINRPTQYTLEKQNGEQLLKVESDGSASALILKREFNPYEYPKIRWRWKVDSIYQQGNAKTREGDDYPLRVYVLFKYDPEKASGWEKIRYGAAKLIYGEYPPHSAINYIWSSRVHPENIITSSYTDRAKMILLRKGVEQVGQWLVEEVDIIEDYQKAFGQKPPAAAVLAVMGDADNTGERAIAYLDFIEIYR